MVLGREQKNYLSELYKKAQIPADAYISFDNFCQILIRHSNKEMIPLWGIQCFCDELGYLVINGKRVVLLYPHLKQVSGEHYRFMHPVVRCRVKERTMCGF